MAEIMRVRSVLTYGTGSPGLSTFYFLPGTAGGVTADATDAVGRVHAYWEDLVTYLKNTFFVNVDSTVDVVDAVDGELTGSLAATPVAQTVGTGADAYLPVAAMLLLQLFTGDVHSGRKVRGRSFIGPVTELANLNGVPSQTVRAAVVAAAADLLTGATATTLVVWSRPDSPPGDPGFHSEVLSFGCASYFAALRSRRD